MTLDLRRYALIYFFGLLGVVVIGVIMDRFSIAMPTGMNVWLPTLVAAQNIGMRHGMASAAPLEKHAAWRLAVPLTVCAVVIQVVFSAIGIAIMTAMGLGVLSYMALVTLKFWIVSFLVVVLAIYISNWVFFPLGVRSGVKAAQRKAEQS